MRIKLLLTFVLIFWTFITNVQGQKLDVSILKSKVLKEKKDIEILSIKKDSSGNLYIFKKDRVDKKFIIEKLTSNFEKVNSYQIDTKFGNVIDEFFLKDDTIGFIEYRKKIEKSIVVNYEVNIYSSNLDSFNFEKRTLLNVEPEKYSFFKGNGTFLESRNHIIFNIKPDSDNGNHKIIVFDKDFNKLWENQFKLTYGDRIGNLVSMRASQNGDVFLLFKITFKKTKKRELGKYYHEIFKISKDNKVSKKLVLENQLVSLKFEINNKDEIACLGFYSDNKYNKLKGFCSFILNSETLKINNKFASKFPFYFFNGANGINKNRKLEELKIRNISFNQNGDIRINAQEIYTSQTAGNFNNMPGIFINTNSAIENYDDIISIKTDKSGELIWSKNINRKNSLGPTGLSFVSYGLINNNREYIVIHSYKNIIDPAKEKYGFHENFLWPITKKNSNLYFVEYDDNGNSICHTLLKNKNQEVVFNVENLQQISKNEVILYGYKKRKIQYLKITFNK